MSFGVVFFDVDSTLVTIEGIDVLGGDRPDIRALTDAAMNGEIAIDEVYGRRLEIIRPTIGDIEALSARYIASLIPDAGSVIARLRAAGLTIHLVTAGIEQAILPLAAELQIPPRAVHAVRIAFDHRGHYRDFDRSSPLARQGGKETVVMNVRARTKGKAAYVGDGVTDLEAKDAVDLFIGFGGVTIRERVQAASDVYITEPRLAAILPLILGDDA